MYPQSTTPMNDNSTTSTSYRRSGSGGGGRSPNSAFDSFRQSPFRTSPILKSSAEKSKVDDDDYNLQQQQQEHFSPIVQRQKSKLSEYDADAELHWIQEENENVGIISYIRNIIIRIWDVPPQYKCLCFIIWIIWKFIFAIIIILLLHHHTIHNVHTAAIQFKQEHESTKDMTRILYIITSLTEYNTGRRNTIKGQDRLGDIVIPILVDSIESILEIDDANYQVDVYMILAYKIQPNRIQMIRNKLPTNVGLQIWDDACPLSYDKNSKQKDMLVDNTRALARQHRYVIKDKLQYYDMFVIFEDDMRLTGSHIQHYIYLSNEIESLRENVLQEQSNNDNIIQSNTNFYGQLSIRQLDRLIPGFIRVEVLQNEKEYGAQKQLDPIPLDYYDDNIEQQSHFNPKYCCHIQSKHYSNNTILINHKPKINDVIIWETSIKALYVQQMPNNNNLDYVVLLPGPGKRLNEQDKINGYWSGNLVDSWQNKPPSPGEPDLIAQQGGWMATKKQLLRWDTLCQGTFLPPFNEPIYRHDGQESMNVEFWSGGYQLFTGVKGGCNMRRIVSMDDFSKHFIYHVANNKQKQLKQSRMVRVDHLYGQINTVIKKAKAVQEEQQQHQIDTK